MWRDFLVVDRDINTRLGTRLLEDVNFGLRGVESLDSVGAFQAAVSHVALIVAIK
jgi:hypothetical protein